MTAAQCLAARRLLGWSCRQLGEAAGLRHEVVRYYERIGNMQGLERNVRHARIQALSAALEAAGIEFVEQSGGGPGVRLKAPL